MLKFRVCLAAILALLTLAAPAGAGTTAAPTAYKRVIGTQGAGDPLT
jgi:hypothetical protein